MKISYSYPVPFLRRFFAIAIGIAIGIENCSARESIDSDSDPDSDSEHRTSNDGDLLPYTG